MEPKAKKPQKILLGGGAGYIGTLLAPLLAARGHTVEVIDLLWFKNHLPADIKVNQKDLFDCVQDDFEGFDQFIFLAGLSNDPMAEHSPSKNFAFNGALPLYLAYLAKRAKVKRFVCASSCSVYGFTHNQAYDESAPTKCDYPYGISKLQGEQGVLQLQDETFSVISLRQGTVSGYSPRMRMDLIVNAMFKSAMLDGKITINNPEIWRPVYAIEDCLQAYVLSVEAPDSVNGIFNVATQNHTVQEVAEKVKKVLDPLLSKPVELERKNFADSRNYKISFEKAKKELGFAPTYTVEKIVEDLYKHKTELGNLDNDDYYNIRIFKQIVNKEELHRQKLKEIDQFKY